MTIEPFPRCEQDHGIVRGNVRAAPGRIVVSVQVVVSHHVADFNAWKPVFEEHGEIRRRHGATGHHLYRSIDDPGQVIVVNEFADEAGARAFADDPSLPEAMQRAGVDGPPVIHFCGLVETVDY